MLSVVERGKLSNLSSFTSAAGWLILQTSLFPGTLSC